MSLPKNVQKLIEDSIPFEITEDCDITSVIMIDGANTGDVYIYKPDGEGYKYEIYENQGGIPARYEHKEATDENQFLHWEEIQNLATTRIEDGWSIRATINTKNGWHYSADNLPSESL